MERQPEETMNISESRPIARLTFQAISTSRAQAQPPSRTLKSKVTNKFHKINHNWQGQRLLPAAPLLNPAAARRT
jgi:hypothetical protein